MAHMKKFSRAACGHMFKHYERAKDENGKYIKFGNQEIDPSKSNLNYNLAPVHRNGQGAFIKERCSEVKMQNRADVNVMCAWIVTAPKELRADEIEKFFRETYKFLSERYGRDNVVSAYIHMDEITPHMHYAFVPVVKDKKKDIWKVSAKEAIDKRDLQTFHKDLSGYLEKIFGRDIGILNEATRDGNKSIEELKQGTAIRELGEIREETEKIMKLKESGEKILQEEKEQTEKLENKQAKLRKEIADLENSFKGKQLKREELDQIKPIENVFGSIKNISLKDVENLKKMAMENLKDKSDINKLQKEIKELKEENKQLKSKVPTLKERMAKAEKEKAINEELTELKEKSEQLKEYIGRMPKKMWEEFSEIINEVKQEKQMENRDDRGYEIGE